VSILVESKSFSLCNVNFGSLNNDLTDKCFYDYALSCSSETAKIYDAAGVPERYETDVFATIINLRVIKHLLF
jgi:hypothetical protein